MKKGVKKFRRKFFFSVIVFVFLLGALFCSLKSSYTQVKEKLDEKEQLSLQYEQLIEEQEALEKEVIRLQNPEYVARYVREKYMYSKDGELILRIGE